MSYRYNVYGVNEVNNAARNYENIADNAPVYADSTATAQARTNLNSAESAYKSTVNGGYKSKYESTVNELVKVVESWLFRDISSCEALFQETCACSEIKDILYCILCNVIAADRDVYDLCRCDLLLLCVRE